MNAIEVSSLRKVYQIDDRLRQRFTEAVGGTKGRLEREVVAINGLSFDLEKGSVLGIVGDNGSGKSTLLKIISEITTPTEGEVRLYGKVSSILEVGTGFHPELSGHDNIYLSGSILGLSKAEIDERYDEVVAFSGLKRFMHIPVKKYSSGMFMRLAFSLAAHLTADIILLDEVLSVGDADFRLKCLHKIRELAKSDKTVVIVSHDLPSILNICTHYLVLEKGEIKEMGESSEILSHYMEDSLLKNREEETETEQRRQMEPTFTWTEPFPANGKVQVASMRVYADGKSPGDVIGYADEVILECELIKQEPINIGVNFLLQYQFMHPVAMINSQMSEDPQLALDGTGLFTLSCKIPARLLNHGVFSVGLYVMDDQFNEVVAIDEQVVFKVQHDESYKEKYMDNGKYYGPIKLKANWSFQVER